MKNKMPRIISLLLVLVISIALLPVNASAEITYDGIEYFFTTFDDLKELAGRSYHELTLACYAGSEPLVIERNLTLPNNLWIENIIPELRIPAGVTFRTSMLDVDDLILDGTLKADEINVHESLSGNGTIKCSTRLIASIPEMNAINVNNMDLSSSAKAVLRYHVNSMADLEELRSLASRDPRPQLDYVAYIFDTPFSITDSVILPANSSLSVGKPLTIEEGCTVEVNSHSAIVAPVTVNGTFVNNSTILVSNAGSGNGKLAFSRSGAYSGSGTLIVLCENRDAISSTISGIDLSHFRITEHTDTDYVLGVAGLRWHLEYMGPDYSAPETEPTEPVDPNLPTITGTYTTDLTLSAADLGVDAPDARLRATLTFREDGNVSTSWEAVDVTALQRFFHQMFVNSYYAMAYGAGITDIREIEAYCMQTTGMSVSDYMNQFVPYDAIRLAFTPNDTRGTYSYNAAHTAILTDLTFMDVPSNPSVENSFVIGGNTLYLNAASWNKPDYTFVCTRQ